MQNPRQTHFGGARGRRRPIHRSSQRDIALSAQARNVGVSSFVFAFMGAITQGRTDGCSSAEAGRQKWDRHWCLRPLRSHRLRCREVAARVETRAAEQLRISVQERLATGSAAVQKCDSDITHTYATAAVSTKAGEQLNAKLSDFVFKCVLLSSSALWKKKRAY